jgi:cytoskeletal protein CcmA (bactofilin family)
VASDLRNALDSLRPALAILNATSGSSGARAHIGSSVMLKGHLTADEDVTIDGRIEGTVEARMNVVTIAPGATILAEVIAKRVVVHGSVTGNVTATEKVDLRDDGSIDGIVTSPRVSIAEGAHFHGSIEMQRGVMHARPDPAVFLPVVARA